VTVAGVAVCKVLLRVPPPDVIDHAPVVALPPTLAPLNVIAPGVADWQAVNAAPGVTVASGLTLTSTEEFDEHPFTSVNKTVYVVFTNGDTTPGFWTIEVKPTGTDVQL
jgi:hypothetical protein